MSVTEVTASGCVRVKSAVFTIRERYPYQHNWTELIASQSGWVSMGQQIYYLSEKCSFDFFRQKIETKGTIMVSTKGSIMVVINSGAI